MLNAGSSRWRKLDNAAKIFPATSGKRDTRVFRFSCELKETIDGMLLQKALDKTVQVYPMFCSVMRKGMFWYYLEKSELDPVVGEESRLPCSSIYIHDKKNLLFEVTYYRQRINFEVYHALTDGTGATLFLKELVKNYLLLAHPEDFECETPIGDEAVTVHDREDDSFSKYYTGTRGKRKKKVRSFQIRSPKTEYGELKITEGQVSARELVSAARSRGVSITVLLTAVFLCSVHGEMSPRQERHPVVLMVPVNLRKYFPSASMLNFFSWIDPGYQFGEGEDSFEDVLDHTKKFFEEELIREKIAARMDELISLEHNLLLRLAPLELKNLCLQAGAKLAEKDVSAIFSNMGVINMPEEYQRYIELFHVYTSTPKIELCMCSFQDKTMLSFTSRFENMNIQRNFFRILEQLGVKVSLYEQQLPEPAPQKLGSVLFLQWFSFVCVVLAVAGVMVNMIFTPHVWWSFFGAGGILCMWLAVSVGYYKRRNLLKNIVWQQMLIIGVCAAWDAVMGWRGWSLEYVFPLTVLLTLATLTVVTKAGGLKAKDYMIYFLISGVTGLVPVLFVLLGWVQVTAPSVVCIGISFLYLAALAIFRRRELAAELHKKFHV